MLSWENSLPIRKNLQSLRCTRCLTPPVQGYSIFECSLLKRSSSLKNLPSADIHLKGSDSWEAKHDGLKLTSILISVAIGSEFPQDLEKLQHSRTNASALCLRILSFPGSIDSLIKIANADS